MDSSDEEVLVIDDNSSSDEAVGAQHSANVSQESVQELSGTSFGSQSSAQRSNEIEVIDLVHSEGSSDKTKSSSEEILSYWNKHPKLKRKIEGSSCWNSPKRVKSNPETNNEKTSNGKTNGVEEYVSPHNSFDEHTYARKILSPGPVKLNKNVGSPAADDGEKGLEKIQLDMSALCSVLYSINKKEIVSVSIDKIYNLTESVQSTSGMLASHSSSPDLHFGSSAPKVINLSSSPLSVLNSANSISSLIQKSVRKEVADGLSPISFSNLHKPDSCVCSKPCICSMVFKAQVINNLESPQPFCKVEPVVTSTSNSDENFTPIVKSGRRGRPFKTKAQTQNKIKLSSARQRRRDPGVKTVVKEEVSSSVPSGVHQCPPDCKYGKDLLVFAKWPADKIYYPAIIHDCFYTDWEYSNNLNVHFFDGPEIKMSSCNIFPASLIVKNILITYKNVDDEYIDGIVKSVQRVHPVGSSKVDTCLSFVIECNEEEDKHFGKTLTIPFTSVALNEHCFKCLKKDIGESILTPHKFSRKTYDVCHDNLIEGKRKRRGVEEAVALILSEEINKKRPSSISLSNNIPKRRIRKIKEDGLFEDTHAEEVTKTKRNRRSLTQPSSLSEMKLKTELPRSSKRNATSGPKMDSASKCASNKQPKENGRNPVKLDRSQIPSTSTTKRPIAVRELVFRNDVVSEEEHSDSEPDDDFESDFDISIVGGGDIDYECTTYTRTSRKSCGNRVIKSSSKKAKIVSDDDENLVNHYGPIPTSSLFAGYSFVLTHAGQNSYYKNKEEWPDCSDTDRSSNDEDTHVFDHLRLRNQIIAGKGQVFSNLLSIPKDSLAKTFVISDFFCRTAHYLLAATLNVPVYSHQVIVQCCIQDIPLVKMLETERPLPIGITSDRMRHKFTKKRKVEAMKSYMVILASTETNQRLRYWTKLIHLSGGKISYFTPERNVIGGMISLASVVIVDDYCTLDLVESAKKNSVPVVSTRWLVDTIIRGHKQTMMSTDLPQYRVDLIMSSQPLASLSESQ